MASRKNTRHTLRETSILRAQFVCKCSTVVMLHFVDHFPYYLSSSLDEHSSRCDDPPTSSSNIMALWRLAVSQKRLRAEFQLWKMRNWKCGEKGTFRSELIRRPCSRFEVFAEICIFILSDLVAVEYTVEGSAVLSRVLMLFFIRKKVLHIFFSMNMCFGSSVREYMLKFIDY